MTEQEWNASADPAAMLAYARSMGLGPGQPFLSDRKARLFACACCRAVWPLLTEERSRKAVEIAELYADGEAEKEEADEAFYTARPQRETGLTLAARWSVSTNPLGGMSHAVERVIIELGTPGHTTFASQSDILRDLAGNPFRPVTLPDAIPRHYCRDCRSPMKMEANHHHQLGLWYCTKDRKHVTDSVTVEEMRLHKQGGCPWLTPTVLSLARAAYEERLTTCRLCKGVGAVDRPVICPPGLSEKKMRRLANKAGGPIPCPSCQGRNREGALDPVRLVVLADAMEEVIGDVECNRCKGNGVVDSAVKTIPPLHATQPCPICTPEEGLWQEGTGRVPHPIIAHLRSPGPHYRGMYSLDLILEKE